MDSNKCHILYGELSLVLQGDGGLGLITSKGASPSTPPVCLVKKPVT